MFTDRTHLMKCLERHSIFCVNWSFFFSFSWLYTAQTLCCVESALFRVYVISENCKRHKHWLNNCDLIDIITNRILSNASNTRFRWKGTLPKETSSISIGWVKLFGTKTVKKIIDNRNGTRVDIVQTAIFFQLCHVRIW